MPAHARGPLWCFRQAESFRTILHLAPTHLTKSFPGARVQSLPAPGCILITHYSPTSFGHTQETGSCRKPVEGHKVTETSIESYQVYHLNARQAKIARSVSRLAASSTCGMQMDAA